MKRLKRLLNKRNRGILYFAVIVAAVYAGGADGFDADTIREWLELAPHAAGAIGGGLALAHLKNDEPGDGDDQDLTPSPLHIFRPRMRPRPIGRGVSSCLPTTRRRWRSPRRRRRM